MGRTGRKPLLWLASYPSSGNTWLRALLISLLHRDGGEPDINQLGAMPSAAQRSLLDAFAGIETCDLRWDEVESLRPAVYRALARAVHAPTFLKIHDRLGTTQGGELLVPETATLGAVYVIRNPLDVVGSFANHFGKSIDETIGIMADPSFTLSPATGGIDVQVPQFVGHWSDHVSSWDEARFPVHRVRYEDLLAAPVDTVVEVLRFAGLLYERDQVARAVAASSFERLRGQEAMSGFRERAVSTRRFFRRGRAGGWREELTAEQAAVVARDHGAVMRRFGYPMSSL